MKDSQLVGLGVGAVGLYILYPTIAEWINAMNPISLLTSRSDRADRHAASQVGRHTTGLLNTGNFCFMNSDIQAMASLPGTYSYLSQLAYLCPSDASAVAPVSSALFYFVRELNKPVLRRTTVSPEPLIAAIEQTYNTRMSRRQHDAHELLHLLLETLQKEYLALAPSLAPGSLSAFPYEGSLLDQIVCGNCHARTQRTLKYLVLSVTVPQKSAVTLSELLTDLTMPEYINDYGCTNCRIATVMNSQSPRDAELQQVISQAEMPLSPEIEAQLPKVYSPITKTQKFDSAPPLLCIHLSRSIYTGSFASRNSCKVDFPLELALPGTSATYRLIAMVRHSGTHQVGHYECNRLKNLRFWRSIDWSAFYDSSTDASDTSDANDSRDTSSPSASTASAGLSSTAQSAPDELGDRPLPFPPKSEPSVSLDTEPAVGTQEGKARNDSQTRIPRNSKEWWAISDEEVRETTGRAVRSLQSGAYLLFYQRD